MTQSRQLFSLLSSFVIREFVIVTSPARLAGPTLRRREHIEMDPAKCGGKPCIAGTRIRVWDIHVWHNLRGQSPEQIITEFPQLSLADVHAALACSWIIARRFSGR